METIGSKPILVGERSQSGPAQKVVAGVVRNVLLATLEMEDVVPAATHANAEDAELPPGFDAFGYKVKE